MLRTSLLRLVLPICFLCLLTGTVHAASDASVPAVPVATATVPTAPAVAAVPAVATVVPVAVVPAAPAVIAPTKPPALVTLLTQIMEVLAYALGLVLTALVGKLVLAFEAKTKMNIPDPWTTKLNGWLAQGIAYAEEQGRKALKGPNAKKLTMPESLEHAADFALSLGGPALATMGKEQLKKLIEARLGATR